MQSFRGRKSLGGSTPRTATRLDDNLFGTDTVEVILAVGEGPNQGIVGGASGFLVADVPLVDPGTTTPNISNFELRVLKGTDPADSIIPNLGGFGSSKSIGLDLRTLNQQVVGAGETTQIDYIDIRFVVGRLFVTNDRGDEGNTTLSLKIEIKARSSSTWTLPFSNEPPPTESTSGGVSNYRPGAQQPGSHVNAAYHETYIQNTAPAVATAKPGAMWFDTSQTNWPPKIRDYNEKTGSWITPLNLTGTAVTDGFYLWTWTDIFGDPRAAWYDQSGQGRSPAAGRMGTDDFLLVPNGNQDVYAWNGVNWNATSDQFASPAPAQPGQVDIVGICRSACPYELRIPVARINEPYDIRVTRISGPETKYYFAQVNWESFQEIKRDILSFPNLAVSHLTIKATDTFTSLPEFAQIWDGRIIKVPTNYDPMARTYSGFWDGTFKLAYTDNPGWVAYDLVMNPRYGKNRYFPEVMDPLAAYGFGQHCDLHKFRMNEYITDPRSISETINYIVGTAGGRYVDRGDGYSTILWDADDQPAVSIFAPENVVDGLFNYSFTDITARKNNFKVSFVNPLIGWVEDRISVYDQNSIDAQGENPEEFIAVGCTDQEEAVRRGRLRLATALTEKTICQFKTNRQGRYLQPFQVVLIADPDAQQVISGRIKSITNSTTIQLRDQVYLEPGIPLTVTFTVSDGAGGLANRSYPISNASGSLTSTLTLASPLDVTLPEKAVFSIGTPKAFRITSIEETEDPDNISISVIEVNRLKWAFVDGTVSLDDILKLQSGPLSRFTYPPTDLAVSGVTRADGTVSAIISWVPGPSQTGGYKVYASYEGQRSDLIGQPGNGTQFELPNLKNGVYVFTVTALSLDGTTESAPASIRFVLQAPGGFRPVVPVTGLRLVDEPQTPIFRKRDAAFTWDVSAEPLFDHYKVDMLQTNGTQIRTTNVLVPGYTYTLDANNIDNNNNNAVRNFSIQVKAVDKQGNLSDGAVLAVTHPAPVAITPQLSALSESIVVQFPKPTEADWQGTLIWVSQTSGFNPLTTTPLDVGMSLSNFIKADGGKTYYVRVAPYDSYSKTGLNISPEYPITVSILLFDPNAPVIPDTPVLTNTLETAPDGTISVLIGATWTQDNASTFGKYEVAFAESAPGTTEANKRYVIDVVQSATWERHGFLPGRLISVKVRALAKNGFGVSGFSPVATVTAALNLTPPANPASLTVIAGFERASLNWTPSTTADLAYTEVWALNGTSSASAPPGGAVIIANVAAGTNVFTDNNLPTTGTRTYWVRSVNTSNTKPTTYTGPQSATSGALTGLQIGAGVIDATKMANGYAVVEVLASLPTTGNFEGRQVFTGGKLYRYTSGAWSSSTAATDITGQITDTQIAALAGSKITGAITNATIDAVKLTGQIVSTQITDNSITTPKILAGAVVTGSLAAGAITASKLTLTDTSNIILNPDFAPSGSLDGWAVSTGATVVINSTAGVPANAPSLYVMKKVAGTSNVDSYNTNFVQVTPGDVYYVECWMVADAGTTGTLRIGMQFQDAAKTANVILNATSVLSAPVNTLATGINTWTRFMGQVVVPAEAATGKPAVLGRVWISHTGATSPTGNSYMAAPKLRKTASAELIVDGSITALKLVIGGTLTANILPCGEFLDGLNGWVITTDARITTVNDGTGPSGSPFMRLNRGVTDSSVSLNNPSVAFLPVEGSTPYELLGYIRGNAASATGAYIRILWFTSAKIAASTAQTDPYSNGAITTAWVKRGGLVTSPSDARFAKIQIYHHSTSTITTMDVASITLKRAVGATQIENGVITTTQLNVGQVFADTAVLNQITTGVLVAGVISTTMLKSGVITTSKLAVQTSNQITNSDFNYGALGYAVNVASTGVVQGFYFERALSAAQKIGLVITNTGDVSSGKQAFISVKRPAPDGTFTTFPVQAGQTYEFSAYVNAYRCAGGQVAINWSTSTGTFISQSISAGAGNATSQGSPLSTNPRAFFIAQAPANATQASLFFLTTFNGTADPRCVFTAPMFAACPATQTEPSPYVSGEITAVDGGVIVTGSINAAKITAGTIDTTRLVAGGIVASTVLAAGSITTPLLEATVLTAQNIKVGTTTLNTWVSGADQTRIDGGKISANSILTNSLKVGSRGLNVVGIEFQMGRDGAGAVNGLLSWTSGLIAYVDNNGAVQSVSVAAGSVQTSGNNYYVFWDVTNGGVLSAVGSSTAGSYIGNPNCVLMATSSTFTGIAPVYGGTIIDGTKITAFSIVADKIAANQIQTQHMAANSINGDRITAGTIVAEKITSGTITAGTSLYIGPNQRTQIYADSNGGRFRTLYNTGTTAVVIGNITEYTGFPDHQGILIYNTAQQLLFSSTGGGVQAAGLAAATGSNRLYNTDFALGPVNVSTSAGNTALGMNLNGYQLPGGNTPYIVWNGTPSANQQVFFELFNTAGQGIRITVSPQIRYEFSCYLWTHRLTGNVQINWLDAGGNYLSTNYGNTIAANLAGAGSGLYETMRSSVFAVAPANAVFADLFVTGYCDGSANPYLFINHPFFGEALPNQSVPSPWANGKDATQITGSNITTFIASAAIGTAQIGDAQITTAKIGNAQILNAKIGNLEVDYIKIANGALSNSNAQGSSGQSAQTSVYSRGNASRFFVCGYRQGDLLGNYQAASGGGALYLQYSYDGTNFGDIAAVPNVEAYLYSQSAQSSFKKPNCTTLSAIFAPSVTGNIIFRVTDTNGQSIGGVNVFAMEIAK